MNYNDSELVYMVKENEDALSIMLKKYEPLFKKLAFSFVKNHPNKGLDVEDLVQQCRITMCSAIERYDHNNQTIFYSYLIVCLKRAIKNYARTIINHPDIYYYMEDENRFSNSISTNEDIYNDMIGKDLSKFIKEFTLDLNFMDACIFELRFNNFSYKEISELLEIDRKRVDNALLKIRKKLEKFLYYAY